MVARVNNICVNLVTIVNIICLIGALEVIPEQTGFVYGNPKYVTDVTFNVRRYSRRSPYVVNIQGSIQQTWGNNVSVNLIFYEFLHNEYKRSFIEMNYKLCDLMNKDPFFSPVVKKTGVPCPAPKGNYNLHNLTMINVPAVDQMPYKWPFEKAKVVALITTFQDKEKILEAYLIASFKQMAVKKKSTLSKATKTP